MDQNWFSEDESENPTQLVYYPVLLTLYHLNGLTDVPPRPTIPLRAIPPRLVIGIKEATLGRFDALLARVFHVLLTLRS